MKPFETHIQWTPTRNGQGFFAIRSRSIDGKSTEYIYRDLDWLKKHLQNDIPYNWNVVKANPDKWFLL